MLRPARCCRLVPKYRLPILSRIPTATMAHWQVFGMDAIRVVAGLKGVWFVMGCFVWRAGFMMSVFGVHIHTYSFSANTHLQTYQTQQKSFVAQQQQQHHIFHIYRTLEPFTHIRISTFVNDHPLFISCNSIHIRNNSDAGCCFIFSYASFFFTV
jgi:hypothetical protein